MQSSGDLIWVIWDDGCPYWSRRSRDNGGINNILNTFQRRI